MTSEKEVRVELSKASSYNTISLLGFIIPIVGWIMCGIAMSKQRNVKYILEDDDELYERYHTRVVDSSIVSGILVILYIGAGLIWLTIISGSSL